MSDRELIKQKKEALIEMTNGFADRYLAVQEAHRQNEPEKEGAIYFRKAGDLGGCNSLFSWAD